MPIRFVVIFTIVIILLFPSNTNAAMCSAIFPSALQNNQRGTGNELINFPSNNSTTNLIAGTVLASGNHFYLGSDLTNNSSISVVTENGGNEGAEGTTARTYFRTGVSWQNVNINVLGNPQDLIIIVDGSLNITGGNTVINAIIYVKGAITISDNATINGAVTSLDSANISGATINYQPSYISKANFNGMCAPALSPVLVAHYKMDEANWGTVVDSVNGFNGIAYNGANTVGGSCRYGKFDGINDYIQIPHHAELNGHGALTYTAFIRANQWTGLDLIMAKSVHGGGSGRAQMGIFSENGVFKVRAETLAGRKEIHAPLPVIAGNWVHVAAVFNGTSLTLYLDGINVASTNFSATTLVQTTDPLNISKRVGTSQYYFDGLIDDIRIYTSALTAQDIKNVINETTLCSLTGVDHYEIVHDGNGLTCAVEPITIKACANSSCSILNNDPISLKLQGNGVTKSSPNFTGSTVVNISDPVAESLTLSINNPSITPSNATVCNNGSIASCHLIFANTGFRFLVNGNVINIPTQLSGKPSNTGYHSANLSLQAIKTNTATGACEAALTNNVTIEVAAKCTNPTSCAGEQVKINGTNIATINNAATLTYTNITANFGSNSNNAAPITLMYPDAGRIQLFPRYNIPVNGSPSGQYMVGSSNGFVVRPLGFYVNIFGNVAAKNATQGVFKKAGQAFTTSISAMQWQLGDDTNNDGKPDLNTLLSDNAVAPNFGHETNSEKVVLDNNLVAPNGGLNPNLKNNIFAMFSHGVQTRHDLSWPEVGIIQLNAHLLDSQYIGTSDVVSTVPYVGRFVPDHLVQTVQKQGTLVGSCGAGSWVYSGEKDQQTQIEGALSYANVPVLRITAYNAQGSNSTDITQNYTITGGEGFMRLLNTGISITAPTTDFNQLGADGLNKTQLTGNITSGSLAQVSGGIQEYTLAATDDFTYTHNANSKISPYIAEIPLAITAITDQDGVMATSTEQALPTGGEVRFGRLNLANSFGPETSDIAQPLTAQYLSRNGDFITNSDDNCTGYNAANIVLSTLTLNKSLTGVNHVIGILSSGKNDAIVLQGVTAGTQGKVGVLYSTFPWLQYDWNKNGSYNDDPSAVATFGLFRGNDRIIYWREVNN